MEERKFPKTTGIKATGKCGHDYDKRIALDTLAGSFRTAENIEAVALLIMREQDFARQQDCPTCHALDITEIVQQTEGALTRWLGVEPLPVLTGTKRTIGFAMDIRHQALLRSLSSQRQSGMSVLTGDRFVQVFVLDAVTSKWGTRAPTGPASPDLASLVKGAEALERMGLYGLTFRARYFREEYSHTEVLSDWLIYRHAMLEWMNPFYQQTEASFWIRHHKGTERYQQTSTVAGARYDAFSESLAADIVANTVAWEDRLEAYTAFTAMVGRAGSVERQALAFAEPGSPLPEVLEQMTVMRALTGSDPVPVTPF